MEAWFREKLHCGYPAEEGAVVAEKGEREWNRHGNAEGEIFPKDIGLENKRG